MSYQIINMISMNFSSSKKALKLKREWKNLLLSKILMIYRNYLGQKIIFWKTKKALKIMNKR